MSGLHGVEQGQGVAGNGLFRGRASAAAVASVVQQIQGVVGESLAELWQVARNILGVSTKIDQGVGAVVGPDGNLQLRVVDGQREQCLAGPDGTELRVVDQRALKHIQRPAERQIQGGQDDDKQHQVA